MAKASFYVNHIKVVKKEDYLVLEAKKMCQHGTVFDEVFLTVPLELASLFMHVEQDPVQEPSPQTLAERFRRFSTDN